MCHGRRIPISDPILPIIGTPGLLQLLADYVFPLKERTRQHLSEFVERIKIALAALTGLVP